MGDNPDVNDNNIGSQNKECQALIPKTLVEPLSGENQITKKNNNQKKPNFSFCAWRVSFSIGAEAHWGFGILPKCTLLVLWRFSMPSMFFLHWTTTTPCLMRFAAKINKMIFIFLHLQVCKLVSMNLCLQQVSSRRFYEESGLFEFTSCINQIWMPFLVTSFS